MYSRPFFQNFCGSEIKKIRKTYEHRKSDRVYVSAEEAKNVITKIICKNFECLADLFMFCVIAVFKNFYIFAVSYINIKYR